MSSPAGPAVPTLIVTGGASDGVEVPIESPGVEKVIGSAASSHLRLTSQNVDGTHAKVRWEDGAVVLNDEGSASGTFVNGERVGAGHVLQDGDRISIGPPGSSGSVRLLVRVPSDLAAAAANSSPAFSAEPESAPLPDFGEKPPAAANEAFVLDSPAFSADGDVIAEAPGRSPAPAPPAIIFDEPAATVAEPSVPARPVPAPPPPPPAPAAVPAPAAAPPLKPPPPPGPIRTPRAAAPPVRPDYMTEIPTIGGDRVREAPDLPPEVAAAPAPKPRARPMTDGRGYLRAGIGVAAAMVTWGAIQAWSHMHKPPPVLSAITPPKAEAGTTITITGTGFESSASRNTVTFGDVKATVTDASDTSLAVTVPPVLRNNAAAVVPVVVQGRGGRSNALFVKVARLPRLTRLEPDVALPGADITLHGQNLDGSPLTVKIGADRVAAKEATAETVRVTVPDMPWTDGQPVMVTVEIGPDSARPMALLLGRLPLVAEVAPSAGPIGQRVALKGRGFDPSPAGNRVTFAGEPSLVFSASPSELQVAVPAVANNAYQAPVPVVVEAHGAASSGKQTFALSHSISGIARLTFFPAPVAQGPPERYAMVSTEMGPVLLLTGKADAPSTAERAGRVAATVTSLVETAASRPVTFEVREGAAPAVAVTGGAVLLTATTDDVDGYAQSWEPGAKPPRSTPRQIAGYWAALLQDYVSLFGQGQRPSRTAELSPRGKVLVDLYAESQRRGGTGGVLASTMANLPPATLKALREMALLLPSGAGGVTGMAVAGKWEGTMEDTEQRRIEVELQVDGGKLGGSLTTKTGEIAVRTPLQQVSYDKGQLKFVTTGAGAARQFRGTLEGGSISGQIFKDATAKDAVGRFSLRYVE